MEYGKGRGPCLAGAANPVGSSVAILLFSKLFIANKSTYIEFVRGKAP